MEDTHSKISLMGNVQKEPICGAGSRLVVGWGWERGLAVNVQEGTRWGDGDVLKRDRDDVCTMW